MGIGLDLDWSGNGRKIGNKIRTGNKVLQKLGTGRKGEKSKGKGGVRNQNWDQGPTIFLGVTVSLK